MKGKELMSEFYRRPVEPVLDEIEFKTSQRRWSVADIPDNIQLTAYSCASELLYGRPPKELKLVNLVKTRTPLTEEHVTGRDQTDYIRLFTWPRRCDAGFRRECSFPIAAAGCAVIASTTRTVASGPGMASLRRCGRDSRSAPAGPQSRRRRAGSSGADPASSR